MRFERLVCVTSTTLSVKADPVNGDEKRSGWLCAVGPNGVVDGSKELRGLSNERDGLVRPLIKG